MRRSAFSLVELSIVLVILGLLVGGILAGQSLIRASELRAASSEGTRYRTAVYAFKDKYFALPGDMANATRFWGVAAGSGSDSVCGNFASTTTATCDGNADGVVLSWAVTFGEMFRFWQHLANAGLIEGQYTGAPNATTPLYTVGRNVPASKVSGGAWGILNIDSTRFIGSYWGSQSVGNALVLGGAFNGEIAREPSIMKPEEAWNIDTKIDDGFPGTGSMQGLDKFGTCQTSASMTSSYALNVNTLSCGLVLFLRM